MKKALVSICITSTILAMFSCRSAEKTVPLAPINGEWNIIEVNDSKAIPGKSRALPFITFDTAAGGVPGNSRCNRMVGNFSVNAKSGSIELKEIASTRMMCPDMTTKRNVLGTLTQVKGYKKAGRDEMFLCNGPNRPVTVLEKKEADVELSILNGEWKVREVDDETITSGMEKQPFITFNVKKKTPHGNAGYSLVNGSSEISTTSTRPISFLGVASTMIAYPDMEVEGKIPRVVNEVKSFDKPSGSGIGLYDANNALMIILEK